MYRKDRLFASDKDRINSLFESLKNVRIVDETAYFNSQPEASPSPTKVSRAREGQPPMSNKPGGKGDRGGGGGGGPSGAAGGGPGFGGFAATKGIGSGIHHPEKGGSANAKGDNYSSHNR